MNKTKKGHLILKLYPTDHFTVDQDIEIRINWIDGQQVSVSINAPRDKKIVRGNAKPKKS